MSKSLVLTKVQKYVICVISLGNLLEWYDIYLYVFWAPTLATLFFDEHSTSFRLFSIIAFFVVGFIIRPLGAIFFGRLGDRMGRKKAFIYSMVFMAIPTFLMGFLPTYEQIGIWAPILLALLRLAQTFPSGGELPGAFCYLYENAGPTNRKFMSSLAGVGNQIGIAIAALESFFLKSILSEEAHTHWGWRISFIAGGFIGLFGFLLRYRLHETTLFQEMVHHHKTTAISIYHTVQHYWKKILHGITFGAAQTIGFHFISILFPIQFFHLSGLNETSDLIATLILLSVTTLPLPFYGLLAERYGVKKCALTACISLLCLLYPFYYFLSYLSPLYTLFMIGLFGCLLTCLTALWPYFLAHLFPTHIRYTGIGLSFNLSDGTLGGLSSLFSLFYASAYKNFNTFIWIMFFGLLISIISNIKIKSSKLI